LTENSLNAYKYRSSFIDIFGGSAMNNTSYEVRWTSNRHGSAVLVHVHDTSKACGYKYCGEDEKDFSRDTEKDTFIGNRSSETPDEIRRCERGLDKGKTFVRDIHVMSEALRGLHAEAIVIADLDRLKVDAAHRAAVRKVLWNRAEEYPRVGYRRRPWLKALEVLSALDKTDPLDQSNEDQQIALYVKDSLDHIVFIADRDPDSWWHSEPLWRAFCEARGWFPEDNL
jgi:hypothetical protein